jgi:hypothetical protein
LSILIFTAFTLHRQPSPIGEGGSASALTDEVNLIRRLAPSPSLPEGRWHYAVMTEEFFEVRSQNYSVNAQVNYRHFERNEVKSKNLLR